MATARARRGRGLSVGRGIIIKAFQNDNNTGYGSGSDGGGVGYRCTVGDWPTAAAAPAAAAQKNLVRGAVAASIIFVSDRETVTLFSPL